ncbi:hypothetical protein KUM39_25265 [Streptomyces sp. J2-1]|uniref:hypothetical protein n=1 Tax=Streptomyces corallincola TaxID=2851888 RepID=UPI001C3880F6|nr:hypothetical protein [Streptomyces corallincola]MBV2357635.1 hypothetical protein [Streptomyces corallincola]
MGIRLLNRRPAEPRHAVPLWIVPTPEPARPQTPVPAVAGNASTARIPSDLGQHLRKKLRKHLTAHTRHVPDWRAWPDLARGYAALLLNVMPRHRRGPRRTLTVFVARVTEPPTGRSPRPSAPQTLEPGPGDAG